MPNSVTEDDDDFVQPEKKGKGAKPNAAPAKSPPVPVAAEPVEEPVKSRFHPKTIEAAERYGISPEDIEACETRSELQWLIEQERHKEIDRNQKQMGRARTGSDGTRATEATDLPAPPTPGAKPAVAAEVEEEWAFENDLSFTDEALRKELGRMGKLVLKASKGDASKSELAEIKKQLEEAKSTIAAMQAANNPVVRRANAIVAKYPALFGSDLEGGAPPEGTDERDRFDMLVARIRRMHESGKATGVPEKDIPVAISALFPGSKPGAVDDEPEPQVVPPSKQNQQRQVVKPPASTPANGVKNRIEEWNDSGQAAPTGRNKSDRTGMADDKGAIEAIKASKRKQGLPISEDDGDDELDDF